MSGATEPPGGPVRSLLWRNRNFISLLLAGLVSLSGSFIGQVAVLILVYSTSRSALNVAYVAVASSIPAVALVLVGGTLADRYDRRRMMILADLVRSGGWGILTLFTVFRGFNLVVVLIIVAISSASSAIFQPAERAILPHLVEEEAIAAANGVLQSSSSVVGFVAFAVGGALVAFLGATPALGYNSLTFLGSAAFLFTIRSVSTRGRVESASEHAGFWSDTKEGFGYVRRERGLLYLTLSAFFGNFFLNLVFTFIVVYSFVLLGGGPIVLGLLLALLAAGTALGALLVNRWRRVLLPNAGKVWVIHSILLGAVVLAITLLPTLVAASAGMLALGFLLGIGGTTWVSATQIAVPTELQGRYYGVDALGSWAIIPLADIIGGVVTQFAGIRTDFLLAGLGMLLSSLAFLPLRPLWRWGTAPSPPSVRNR